MVKYKHLLCIIFWTLMPQISMAIDFELSDKIREARESELKLVKTQIKQNVEQAKENYKTQSQPIGEQMIVEKLKPNEIMQFEESPTKSN